MGKKYDVVVKTGEYTSGHEIKARWERVGYVMENEKGEYMILKKTFNPAGINVDGDMITLSFVDPEYGE